MTAEEIFRGRLIMAPMSRGTDLPFRRLLREWGAEVCVGEMAYAHKIVKRERSERPLLRRHPDEKVFGVQRRKIPRSWPRRHDWRKASGPTSSTSKRMPLDEVTRRGMGAASWSERASSPAWSPPSRPRSGSPDDQAPPGVWSEGKPTYSRGEGAEEAGVDAIRPPCRSRRPALPPARGWKRRARTWEAVRVPVIGNGDVMTWRDAVARRQETGCAAVMVGRWALAKPWIFREWERQEDLVPGAEERLAIVRRYVELCREAFRDDEKGRVRTRRFLTFHQDLFRRLPPQRGLER